MKLSHSNVKKKTFSSVWFIRKMIQFYYINEIDNVNSEKFLFVIVNINIIIVVGIFFFVGCVETRILWEKAYIDEFSFSLNISCTKFY